MEEKRLELEDMLKLVETAKEWSWDTLHNNFYSTIKLEKDLDITIIGTEILFYLINELNVEYDDHLIGHYFGPNRKLGRLTRQLRKNSYKQEETEEHKRTNQGTNKAQKYLKKQTA